MWGVRHVSSSGIGIGIGIRIGIRIRDVHYELEFHYCRARFSSKKLGQSTLQHLSIAMAMPQYCSVCTSVLQHLHYSIAVLIPQYCNIDTSVLQYWYLSIAVLIPQYCSIDTSVFQYWYLSIAVLIPQYCSINTSVFSQACNQYCSIASPLCSPIAGLAVARACTGWVPSPWTGGAISSWSWHTSTELSMYRTLNEGLKGFRANLKPENRPWGLFAHTVSSSWWNSAIPTLGSAAQDFKSNNGLHCSLRTS
jgi:hypothetical protein